MYTYGMYTYGMSTYGMYTYGMYTYGMQGMRQDFGSANYAGIAKWAQLDLQRIQHRDYVGHLFINLILMRLLNWFITSKDIRVHLNRIFIYFLFFLD